MTWCSGGEEGGRGGAEEGAGGEATPPGAARQVRPPQGGGGAGRPVRAQAQSGEEAAVQRHQTHFRQDSAGQGDQGQAVPRFINSSYWTISQ
jgi:hypothetical protein